MEKQTITIYDVAREAGVSMATVSRVVNGNPNVKPSTRKKVSEVIERLDYRPNAVARGLASKKTTTVGVIIPNVTDLFYSSLARGIDDIASMYKYNIILANSDENREKEVQVLNTLLAKQVDGLIFMGSTIDETILKELRRTTTPVVLAGTVISEPDILSVNIDYLAATKEATELLLSHNRTVAVVTGPGEYEINKDHIVKGYKEALEEKGIDFNEDLVIQSEYTFKDGDKIVDLLLDAGATAVVVSKDEVAIGILNALIERGVNVPDDFEIITSNNSMLTQVARPQLTSIQFPLYDIGAVAMRLLTKVMNNEEVEEPKVLLPHKIFTRQSTK
ncbi:catabolite control protein A [Fundicoccus culcitae]|uniref:Catabolite control protein A n=1 Tax=Fundicoccus culcitae TaxID=2969821 RepID=A0ABY5P6M2_9LACT|nr:catabolite control protein A [Fundicoccus culcitae]UUX34377.1 catabolite control protein A [Fundicoccus culcitae]